jgi:TP901 family phage tail tape measure protein
MSSGVQFKIEVLGGNSVQTIGGVVDNIEKGAKATTGWNEKLKGIGEAAFVFNNIRSAIGDVVSELNAAVQPGINFNSSLTEMQAITGVTDEKLKELGDNARKLAKDFGIDAAGAVESNKLLLSQLSPELANNAEALDSMSRSSAILSKQMSNDVAAATGVLTTAMNQYGISLDDPIQASKAMSEMMNIMAAAAKEGSAELPQIQMALQQAGMMAKTANVPFNELNAAIQILDKSGKKGAEGGVALRNVMAKLSEGNFLPKTALEMLKQAGIDVDKLGDKSLTLSQRLSYLKPIANDTAAMTNLFGAENAAAGIALVNNSQAITEMTGKITGTNTATDMATTIMGSFSERLARTNAWFKDLGISIFNATDGFLPFIQMGMGGLQTVAALGGAIQAVTIITDSKFGASMLKAATGARTWLASTSAATLGLLRQGAVMVGSALASVGSFVVGLVSATAAQIGLNVAMTANPIGLIVVGIAAAIAAIAALIANWDWVKQVIIDFGVWMWEHSPFGWLTDIIETVFPGFKQAMGELWDWIAGKFSALFGWVKDAAGWVSGLFGGAATTETTKEEPAAGGQKSALASQLDEELKLKRENERMLAEAKAMLQKENDPEKRKLLENKIKYLSGETDLGAKGGHGGKKNGNTETASNITSGGSKPNTINLTIHKLQDQTVIHTTNLEMGGKQAAARMMEMILEQINGVNAALAGG